MLEDTKVAGFERLQVLLVEDDAFAQRLAVSVLKQLGITKLVVVKDGQAAIDQLNHEDTRYDLIISDWNMPNVTGLDLLKHVRKTWENMPFLMLTGNANEEFVRIAQANITNWVGVGATSGSTAANNWNGNGGVSVAQIAPGTRLPTDPAYNSSNDVVVFRFGFTLGSATAARTLAIDTPTTGLGRETNTTTGRYGDLYASWFTSTAAAQGTRFYNDIGVEGASVNVVPAPASLARLGLGGLVAGRRRR